MGSFAQRAAVPLVLLLLAISGVIIYLGSESDDKIVTAYFPRTVGLYEGSDVRVLGVGVGKIDTVTPEGTQVKVVMHYDKEVDVPSDVRAVVISPSIVGDRYVQLTPAYSGSGKVLADNTVLDRTRTAVPLELDQVYGSLDKLTVALGPNGANSKGALNDLLEVTARNFGGQGKQFNTTIKNFSRLSQTLDDNKDELFGSAAELQKFITTLADNDTTVRRFNTSLGRVSTTLAGERQELGSALSNLAVALDEVGDFVRDNRAILTKNISGLNKVSKTIVKQRANLDETLRLAPIALNNLQLAYNPDAGTLDTNANIGELFGNILGDPKQFLCSLVSANDPSGAACDLIDSLPLPRTSPFAPGTGSSSGDAFDPTLGGLVGVDQ